MKALLTIIILSIFTICVIGYMNKYGSLKNDEQETYLSLQEITILENKILCSNNTSRCYEIIQRSDSLLEYSGEIENFEYEYGTRYFITAELTFYNSGTLKNIKSQKIITQTPYPFVNINSQKDNESVITSANNIINGTGQFLDPTSIQITAITNGNLVIGQGNGKINSENESIINWSAEMLYTEIHEGKGFLKVKATSSSDQGNSNLNYSIPVYFTSNKAFLLR